MLPVLKCCESKARSATILNIECCGNHGAKQCPKFTSVLPPKKASTNGSSNESPNSGDKKLKANNQLQNHKSQSASIADYDSDSDDDDVFLYSATVRSNGTKSYKDMLCKTKRSQNPVSYLR